MLVNFKGDQGGEIIINMNQVHYIQRIYSSTDYGVYFEGRMLKISWQEYDKLTKAIEEHSK